MAPSRIEMEPYLESLDDKDGKDIELDTLQDIVVTPQAVYTTTEFDSQDFDDDIEHGSDGTAALLGSDTITRSRGGEQVPFRPGSVWSQVGSIVVEVSFYNFQIIIL